MQSLTQHQTRQILAHSLKNNAGEVRSLLKMNGVNANTSTQKNLNLATLTAVRDSPQFRKDFVSFVQNKVNATRRTKAKKFLNSVDSSDSPTTPLAADISDINDIDIDDSTQTVTVGSSTLPTTIATPAPTPTPAATSSSTSSGGLFSSLGSIFSGDSLSKLLGTGLSTLSTSLTSSANNTAAQTALQIEQTKLAEQQAANAGTGLSTTVIAVIAVVGLGILGTVIYFATKKK